MKTKQNSKINMTPLTANRHFKGGTTEKSPEKLSVDLEISA